MNATEGESFRSVLSAFNNLEDGLRIFGDEQVIVDFIDNPVRDLSASAIVHVLCRGNIQAKIKVNLRCSIIKRQTFLNFRHFSWTRILYFEPGATNSRRD